MHNKRPDGMFPWLPSNDALAVVRPTGVYLLHFFFLGYSVLYTVESYLCLISFLYLEYVLGDDALIS